jgi:hypothetical protein
MLPDSVREQLHQHNDAAKRAAFIALQQAYRQARIVLHPDRADASMGFPPRVLERYHGKHIPLDIGLGLARPATWDTTAVLLYATLSFSGEERYLGIPWRVIGGMHAGGDAFAWEYVGPSKVETPAEQKRGGLRVIKGGAA